MGALLCLWILAKIDLPQLFRHNIGLNVALALGSSRIDWGAISADSLQGIRVADR